MSGVVRVPVGRARPVGGSGDGFANIRGLIFLDRAASSERGIDIQLGSEAQLEAYRHQGT